MGPLYPITQICERRSTGEELAPHAWGPSTPLPKSVNGGPLRSGLMPWLGDPGLEGPTQKYICQVKGP